MHNFIRFFIIAFSLLITLTFGYNNQQNYTVHSQAFSIPIETTIVSDISSNETVAAASNYDTAIVKSEKQNNHFTGRISFLPDITEINSLINYSKYKYITNNPFRYFTLYLRNEICVRAP